MKDPNNTRDTAPRRGSPLWIYIVCVATAGAAVTVVSLAMLQVGDLTTLAGHPLYWILACFILFGELKPIITPGSNENNGATISTAITFAVLLYAGLPAAVLLHATATVVTRLVRRQALFRVTFNVAQYMLSFGAAALALLAFGIHASPMHPWVPDGAHLVAMAVAGAAYFIVNELLVNTAIALHERSSLFKSVRWDLPYQVLVHVALLALAPLVVVAMQRSVAFVPLFALPFMAVYLNASVSVRREHQALHDSLTGLSNRKLLIVRTEEALAEARHRAYRNGGQRVGAVPARPRPVQGGQRHARAPGRRRAAAARSPTGCAHRVRAGRPGGPAGRRRVRDPAAAGPRRRGRREVAAQVRAALDEPLVARRHAARPRGQRRHRAVPRPRAATSSSCCGGPTSRCTSPRRPQRASRSTTPSQDAQLTRPARPARRAAPGHRRAASSSCTTSRRSTRATADCRGVEALVRWQHPTRGLRRCPTSFIPLAEQSGLMRRAHRLRRSTRRWARSAALAATPASTLRARRQRLAPRPARRRPDRHGRAALRRARRAAADASSWRSPSAS